MKKHLKTMLVYALVMATCSPSWASQPQPSPSPQATINAPIDLTPQETADLIQLFKACDHAQQSCAQANRDKDAVIAKQGEVILAGQQALATERAAHTGIMESKTTWFVLGVLFTGLTVFLVSPRR